MPKFNSMGAFYDAREQSKRWAIDYLRLSQLGKQSLAEGWCRALHNSVWQWHFRATCDGREMTFGDVKPTADDIAYWRKRCVALNPRLEASIVLREPIEKHMTPEEVAEINSLCAKIKATGKGILGVKEMPK